MKTMEATYGAYPQVNDQAGFGFHKLFMTGLAAGLMGVLSYPHCSRHRRRRFFDCRRLRRLWR